MGGFRQFLGLVLLLYSSQALAGLRAISTCEALLAYAQQQSPTRALVTSNTKDAIYVLQKFRRVGLRSENEKPEIAERLTLTSDNASQEQRDKIAGEIRGIEEQFFSPEATSTIDQASHIVGLNRRGAEQVSQYFAEIEYLSEELAELAGGYYRFTSHYAPDTPIDKGLTNAHNFLIEETTAAISRAATAPNEVAGKWIFSSTSFEMRKATIDTLIRANGKIDFPTLENEATNEIIIRTHGIFERLTYLLEGLERYRHLYNTAWIHIDQLVTFDEAGVPTLTVIVRTSLSKPQFVAPKRKRAEQREINWAPDLAPAPATTR